MNDAFMNSLRIVVFLLTATLVASMARAQIQTDKWEALKSIPEGTKIKVTLNHGRTFGHCRLYEVTDDWLGCYYNSLGDRQYTRADVRTVSLGHHTARTGLFVGAGAGLLLGASNTRTDSAGRIFSAIVLTPVLAGIGAGIGAIADPFRSGKTVYRAPKPAKDSPPLQPSTPRQEAKRENLTITR